MQNESTWVGMENLEKSQPSSDDHVVWVIVPNSSNTNEDVYNNNTAQTVHPNSMVISSTTETVYDSMGNKTNIQIAEITHHKKKQGRKNLATSQFVCDICGLKYSRNFNLRRHKENVHAQNSESITCPQCSSTFTRNDNLKAHIKYVHNNLGCKSCPMCGKLFTREHTLKDHISVQHLNVRKYQCVKCGKCFGYPFSLFNHVRVKHECDGAFKCYYCSKVFATIKLLRNHVLSIHEGVRYKCKICKRVLKCQSAYKAHLKTFHLPTNVRDKYFCSRCPYKCSSKPELLQHMSSIHMWTQAHVCPICHKPVKHRGTFDRHLQCHNQNENDISFILQKHFNATEKNLNQTSIKRQVCVEPKPDFTASLIVSQNPEIRPVSPTESLTNSSKTIFECSFCNKIFNSRYMLDRHYEKAHSYVCNFCSALFFSYEAIVQHEIKFHQGESVLNEEMGGRQIGDFSLGSLYDDPENIWSIDSENASPAPATDDSGQSS